MDSSRVNGADGELLALRAATALVAEGASPGLVLEMAARHIADAVSADFVEILRLDSRGRTPLFAAWEVRDATIIDFDHRLFEEDHLAREVMREQKAVRKDDVSGAAVRDVADGEPDITSSVGVPIMLSGKVWGALFVHSTADALLPADTRERLSGFNELIGSAVANSRMQAEMEQLLAEQSALLRVAELVARESAPEDVFHAVAEQLGRVTHVSGTQVFRFDDEELATSVGSWGPVDSGIKVGRQLSTSGNSVIGQVRATGLPARVEDYSSVEGQLGALQRGAGMRSAAGAPIRAAGRLWGALIVGSVSDEALPAETEERMAKFADLVGVALSNLDARNSQRVLAEEQEALRRVATVVAREEWHVILPTIVRELALLHRVEGTVLIRYENDELATILAAWGEPNLEQFIGQTLPFGGSNPGDYVWHSQRPARQHGFTGGEGHFADLSVQLGITETLAGPVFVENRLWGAIVIVTTGSRRLPSDAESRLGQFAELIATAIGNMKSRLELIESRARIVLTADQTRRRFERDLHDGIQQRLVSISMDLRNVEQRLPAGDESRSRLSEIADSLVAALDGLRELSRGIHPAILSEGGLVPAARSLARRSTIPVTLNLPQPARHPDSVEVAAYYVMSEALANTAKYAQASKAEITLAPVDGALVVIVSDDGIGGADITKGSGLIGLEDRVEALGGSFSVQSPPMSGTTITATLPLILV